MWLEAHAGSEERARAAAWRQSVVAARREGGTRHLEELAKHPLHALHVLHALHALHALHVLHT